MSWLLTHTGKRFHPIGHSTEDFDIQDIAHALANLCRFAGHTRKFYSIAQHCTVVSRILEEQGFNKVTQLRGLLHDASEAYLVDIPMPVKILDCMAGYRELEKKVEDRIAERFELESLTNPSVKRADMIALAMEARDLMGDPKDWESLIGIEPMRWEVYPMTPTQARRAFLTRFAELT